MEDDISWNEPVIITAKMGEQIVAWIKGEAMTELTMPEVRALLRRAGATKRQARVGAAISMCEAPVFGAASPRSNFAAVGDQELANDTWGYSYGGFQIRSLRSQKGTGGIRDEDELLDPAFNSRSAYAIFQDRGNWSAWSTFTSGMYKAYLPDLFPPAPGTYVVVAGDSLSGIAAKLPGDWGWEDLARVNALHSPYSIYIGQSLTLPE